ncbi:MAG: diacylglycerol kinase family protein [Steroidobacteraceae bacterium]
MTDLAHHSPARRALVLLNPNARRGRGRSRYTAVKAAIDQVFDARVVETEPTGNDGPIRAALDDGIRTFIAAGGDGTVNAVIDALVRLRGPIALEDLTLGAVGLGSSNDAHKPLEREIAGIPVRIDAPHAVPRDVGMARWDGGERAFLVSASVGVTAAANALFNREDSVLRLLKHWWVDGAIIWAAVRTIATWRNLSATLIVHETSSTIALTHLGVAKTPWLAGGLHYDTPVEPGRFAVNLCEGMGRLRTISTLAALARGRFVGLPGTRSWSAPRASVVLEEPCDLELDGEIFRASRVSFDLLRERIRLCS